MNRPIVWSISGTDSGGGAGIAADQRAADAFSIHLCTVIAAVSAQNSRGVEHVEHIRPEVVDAQMRALADDMRPITVKTGLLGGAEQIRVIARWIDRLREQRALAFVVDPVLAASTGARFVDDEALQAYRDELVPRASVITPNRAEAYRLLNREQPAENDLAAIPELARALRAMGAQAVCITGGDAKDAGAQALDWVSTEHAEGWLASPRVQVANQHGTGCTFATSIACALALGFVATDAVVLAKMATTQALRNGYQAGAGSGPVRARGGFADDRTLLPRMSWGEAPWFAAPRAFAPNSLGLYPIVDSADRVREVVEAGARSVQLRIKGDVPKRAGPWATSLKNEIERSIAVCAEHKAQLFINDHWKLALDCAAPGIHLGQSDVLALDEQERRALVDSGVALGISSHSIWELCRARSLGPRYIACGPVWPTTTKDMPWRPQGLWNLRWWRHMAGTPVVAIGGITMPEQARAVTRCGVDGVCLVRAVGGTPSETLPSFQEALEAGRSDPLPAVPAFPQPSLPNELDTRPEAQRFALREN